jgi:hypothetical protein
LMLPLRARPAVGVEVLLPCPMEVDSAESAASEADTLRKLAVLLVGVRCASTSVLQLSHTLMNSPPPSDFFCVAGRVHKLHWMPLLLLLLPDDAAEPVEPVEEGALDRRCTGGGVRVSHCCCRCGCW